MTDVHEALCSLSPASGSARYGHAGTQGPFQMHSGQFSDTGERTSRPGALHPEVHYTLKLFTAPFFSSNGAKETAPEGNKPWMGRPEMIFK